MLHPITAELPVLDAPTDQPATGAGAFGLLAQAALAFSRFATIAKRFDDAGWTVHVVECDRVAWLELRAPETMDELDALELAQSLVDADLAGAFTGLDEL